MTTGIGESAFMVAAPEAAVPLLIGKQLAPHAPALFMVPLVVLAIVFILVGIVVLSAASSKTPGALLLVLGFLLGGGAFLVMYRAEKKKTN